MSFSAFMLKYQIQYVDDSLGTKWSQCSEEKNRRHQTSRLGVRQKVTFSLQAYEVGNNRLNCRVTCKSSPATNMFFHPNPISQISHGALFFSTIKHKLIFQLFVPPASTLIYFLLPFKCQEPFYYQVLT